MKKVKILITGSGGFIFSNFIRKVLFNSNNYKIISIDKVQKTSAINNIYTNKNHKFFIGDVTDEHFMDIVFHTERPDIVIHGAGVTNIDNSITSAVPFVHNNVIGTQVVIDNCLKYDIKKLIYISTDQVYGHLESESLNSWTEESNTNPRNPYAVSKLASEMFIKAASNTHGLVYNIIRACNNFGPRQTPDKFLPKIIKCILNNKKVPIYDQGLQVRDWIYVDDTISGIINVLELGKDNEIYNISAGQEISNIELFQKICNILGRGYELIEYVKNRPGHDFRYSMNSSKLKQLGWNPEFTLKSGLPLCIKWFVDNQYWFLKDYK